jgi:tripartite-type tricarboxylate transporter receptor subunit TctC
MMKSVNMQPVQSGSEARLPRRRALLAVAASAILLPLAGPAIAQGYPDRVIRLVSPVSPGTGVDDYVRLLARHLSLKLVQSVVVENKPGANMIVASEFVAKSEPDGYTIYVSGSSAMAANPYLYKRLPYDPNKDFAAVARLTALPMAVVVAAASPYKSVADLAAAARRKPSGLNCASATSGFRVLGAAFGRAANIRNEEIPYKGMSQLVTDMVGGVIDYSVVDLTLAGPLIQSGKLRAVAVPNPKRVAMLPDVPALVEAGLPDHALVNAVSRASWTGLFVPAGTPAPIIEKLARFSLEFVQSPEAKAFHAARGGVPNPGSGPELARNIQADQQVWKQLIAAAGLK